MRWILVLRYSTSWAGLLTSSLLISGVVMDRELNSWMQQQGRSFQQQSRHCFALNLLEEVWDVAAPLGGWRPTSEWAPRLGSQCLVQTWGSEQAGITLSSCRVLVVVHKFANRANEESVFTWLLIPMHFTWYGKSANRRKFWNQINLWF